MDIVLTDNGSNTGTVLDHARTAYERHYPRLAAQYENLAVSLFVSSLSDVSFAVKEKVSTSFMTLGVISSFLALATIIVQWCKKQRTLKTTTTLDTVATLLHIFAGE